MNFRLFYLSIRCTLLLCLVQPARAQQWTQFRGPGGTGQYEAGQCETGSIPATWTTKDYNWRVKLPGIGHSSPVIWDQRIFVTCAIEENATRIIRCLDTSDGGLVWKRDFPSTTYDKNALNSFAAATPTVDQHHVYITWTTPQEYIVTALDRENGRQIWRRDLGPFMAEHGYGASPILFDSMLIVTGDKAEKSFVAALDAKTGETRWKVDRRSMKAAYSTPCIHRPADGPPELILTSWAHGVSSLDPQTGNMNWEVDVLEHRVVCSPVIAAGLIFTSCGSGGGGKQMVAVRPRNAAKAVEAGLAYEIKGSLPYVPTSVAAGALLFLWSDSGVVTCLDAPTGKRHWQQRVGGNFFGSPVRVGQRIYCMSRDGHIVVLAAADRFKLLARVNLEEPSSATPAVADGVMYLRTVSHLMSLGGK